MKNYLNGEFIVNTVIGVVLGALVIFALYTAYNDHIKLNSVIQFLNNNVSQPAPTGE